VKHNIKKYKMIRKTEKSGSKMVAMFDIHSMSLLIRYFLWCCAVPVINIRTNGITWSRTFVFYAANGVC